MRDAAVNGRSPRVGGDSGRFRL